MIRASILLAIISACATVHAQPGSADSEVPAETRARQKIEGDFCTDGTKTELKLEALGDCPQCATAQNAGAAGLTGLAQQTENLQALTDQARKRESALAFHRFINTDPAFNRWVSYSKGSYLDTIEGVNERLATVKSSLEETKKQLIDARNAITPAERAKKAVEAIPKKKPSAKDKETIEKMLEPRLEELTMRKTRIETFKKKVENLIEQQKKAGKKTAVLVNPINGKKMDAKATMDRFERDLQRYNDQIQELQTLKDWLDPKKTAKTKIKPELAAALKERFDSFHQEAQSQVETALSEIKYFENEIVQLSARLEKLEAEKLKEGQAPAPELDQLREYEAQAKKYIGDQRNTSRMTPSCGLTLEELMALHLYTGSYYEPLNKALRSGQGEQVKIFTETLQSALAKIKPYLGLVRRGASLPPEAVSKYAVGGIVTYPGFTSTSLSNGFGGNHLFVIKSKTGRLIAPYSGSYGEMEVLFPAGSRFKVLEMKKTFENTQITLEEVD